MVQKKTKTIQWYLILIISLLILISGVLLPILNNSLFINEYSRQTSDYLEQITEQLALNIETYLNEVSRLCLSPYYSDSFMELLETPVNGDMEALVKRRKVDNYLKAVMTTPRSDIYSVYIFTDDGVYGSSRRSNAFNQNGYEKEDWYQAALSANEFVYITPDSERNIRPGYTFSIAHQLRSISNNNNIIGVIRVDANFNGIKATCEKVKTDERYLLEITDDEGNIIYESFDNQRVKASTSPTDMITSTRLIRFMGWTIRYSVLDNVITDYTKVTQIFNVIASVVLVLIGVTLTSFAIRRLMRPLYQTVEVIRKVEEGNLEVRAPETERIEVSELNRSFNSMLDRIGAMMEKEKKLTREIYQAKYLHKQAQFNALYHQMQPHFIFNTLTSIDILIKNNHKEQAVESIHQLSVLLRGMINADKMISLNDELEILDSYIKLEQLRHDDLAVSVDIGNDVDLSLLIPAMIIQPVVENSLKHGYETKKEEKIIEISIYKQDTKLFVEVEDNGDGIRPEALNAINERLESEDSDDSVDSVGLWNIDRRLKLLFGKGYGLRIDSDYSLGTLVTIMMPGGRNV